MQTFWLQDYIGIEFEERGRFKKVDCWGLFRRVYCERFGVLLPSFTDYESTKEIEQIAKIVKGNEDEGGFTEIPFEKRGFADLILFRIQGQPVHVGLIVNHYLMLHIEKGKNSCLEKYKTARWKPRIYKVFRHEKFL